jgi:hypothetical protein
VLVWENSLRRRDNTHRSKLSLRCIVEKLLLRDMVVGYPKVIKVVLDDYD